MEKSGSRFGQSGSLVLIVAVVILVAALISMSAFAVWSYNGRRDYKNNLDTKVAAAVDVAKQQASAVQKKTDDEQAKLPVLTFTGPVAYGAVTFNYPRTWNGYVDESDSQKPIKAFFYNGLVPSGGVFYSLRVELVDTDYPTVLKSFDNAIKKGLLTSTAYVPPTMVGKPNVQTGTRFDGQIENNSQNNPVIGSMVTLNVRDKTLKIYTESPSYLSDFNNIVLGSLTYVP